MRKLMSPRFFHPIPLATDCARCEAPAVYLYVVLVTRRPQHGGGRARTETPLCQVHSEKLASKDHLRLPDLTVTPTPQEDTPCP